MESGQWKMEKNSKPDYAPFLMNAIVPFLIFHFPFSIFVSSIFHFPFFAAVDTPGNQVADTYREMIADSWFVQHSLMISLLLLVLLVAVVIRRRRRTLQIFSNAHGKVHVSQTALSDLIESAAREYGAIARPRAYFVRRRGKLEIYLRLKVGTGQTLPQFSNGLQMRVAAAVRDAFGIQNLGGVHVIITGYREMPVADDGMPPRGESSSVPYYGASPAKPAKTTPRTDGEFFGNP